MRPLCLRLLIIAAIFGVVYCVDPPPGSQKYNIHDVKLLRYGLQYASVRCEQGVPVFHLFDVIATTYQTVATLYNWHCFSPKLPLDLPALHPDTIHNLGGAAMLLDQHAGRSPETVLLGICIRALSGLLQGQSGIPHLLEDTLLSIAGPITVREMMEHQDRYDDALRLRRGVWNQGPS
jgi:hypothetical protein